MHSGSICRLTIGSRSGDATAKHQGLNEAQPVARHKLMMKPVDTIWVGLGGGLGSVLRWWVGRLVGERYKGLFPLGTFLINI